MRQVTREALVSHYPPFVSSDHWTKKQDTVNKDEDDDEKFCHFGACTVQGRRQGSARVYEPTAHFFFFFSSGEWETSNKEKKKKLQHRVTNVPCPRLHKFLHFASSFSCKFVRSFMKLKEKEEEVGG